MSQTIVLLASTWWAEKSFGLTEKKQYLAETITDNDYADDLPLLVNTPTQAEYLLHSLEQKSRDISLHVNADKTECMCFNQENITLNSGSLNFVDKFTYLGSSIISTESDISMHLAKAWTAIDRLSIIWKSSKQRSCQFYYMDAPHERWQSVLRKRLARITQEYYELFWINPRSNIPRNSCCVATYLLSLKPSK